MRKIEEVAKYYNISLKKALEKRLELLIKSKKEKWNEFINPENTSDLCPFCYETICRPNLNRLNCENCLCPPDICDNVAYTGYINKITSKTRWIYTLNLTYKEKRKKAIKSLKEQLPIMIGLFDKWIKETEKDIIELNCDNCKHFHPENSFCESYGKIINQQESCEDFDPKEIEEK